MNTLGGVADAAASSAPFLGGSVFFLNGNGTPFVVGLGGKGMLKIGGAGAESSTSPSSGDELSGRFALRPYSGDLEACLLRGVDIAAAVVSRSLWSMGVSCKHNLLT